MYQYKKSLDVPHLGRFFAIKEISDDLYDIYDASVMIATIRRTSKRWKLKPHVFTEHLNGFYNNRSFTDWQTMLKGDDGYFKKYHLIMKYLEDFEAAMHKKWPHHYESICLVGKDDILMYVEACYKEDIPLSTTLQNITNKAFWLPF